MQACRKNSDGTWLASVYLSDESGEKRRLSRRCASKSEARRWLDGFSKPRPNFGDIGFPNLVRYRCPLEGGIVDASH